MVEAVRISAETVREKVTSGSALLVCAYETDQDFKEFRLEGAIPLSEFKSRRSLIEKDNKIIFYCA